jgi:hypothetical protein
MIFASEYLHEERPGMQVAADPRREEALLDMDVGINLWWGGGVDWKIGWKNWKLQLLKILKCAPRV